MTIVDMKEQVLRVIDEELDALMDRLDELEKMRKHALKDWQKARERYERS